MVRIIRAEYIRERTFQVTLTTGETVERDLTPYLTRPLFNSVLDDPALLKCVHVEDGTLAWSNGLDLDPDVVIWGGPPPTEERIRVG